ncbi:MAG: tetratricopeptide repeat protein, partial [Elusimicrobiales bacterium]|nr:tetratricopeptide repeat protein [Elusimicrobiales bacterium]
IYMMNSDYSKALEFYDKAYKSDPYDANILLNIAKAYIKLNKSEDAKLFFNKAVAIDPELGKFKEDLFKN